MPASLSREVVCVFESVQSFGYTSSRPRNRERNRATFSEEVTGAVGEGMTTGAVGGDDRPAASTVLRDSRAARDSSSSFSRRATRASSRAIASAGSRVNGIAGIVAGRRQSRVSSRRPRILFLKMVLFQELEHGEFRNSVLDCWCDCGFLDSRLMRGTSPGAGASPRG